MSRGAGIAEVEEVNARASENNKHGREESVQQMHRASRARWEEEEEGKKKSASAEHLWLTES